ncbi:Wzz/FepE/Etk N-terminal domain-containing protein, partial [Pseudorhodobacter sp.]|uniref:GumC family protein n=1 Tax=Pseudorhodobacter sp. TaxID=1934400 RepID=UPI0026496BED
MGQIQSIEEFIGLLFRRRLLIGAVTVFGIVMTLLYVIAKPDVFESTAVIQVQGPTVSSSENAAAARETSAQRLQAIQQQLTTRENMLAVIERQGLYHDLPLSDDQKVHLLRIALKFDSVASAASTGFGTPSEVSALLISAQADTRAKAAHVANDFAQGILDAGAAEQNQRTEEAARFFKDEADQLQARIAALESEIATYKTAHRDALPTQRDIARTELSGLETELRSLDQALVAARNELAAIQRKTTQRATDKRQADTLETQIETLAAQGKALEDRRGEIMASLGQSPEVDRTLSEYDRSLDQLQAQFEVANRRAAEAETTQKLQERQQGETFTMLERAAEPDYPISGGRRKLAFVGAVGSLVFGVIVAFLLDLLNPVIRTRGQLERELDLRPIVAIPPLRTKTRPFFQSLIPPLPALDDLARGMPRLSATSTGTAALS